MFHQKSFGESNLLASTAHMGIPMSALDTLYMSVNPTVVEAVQDAVEALFELKDEYILFTEMLTEMAASIETFANLSQLPNIVGAIDGMHVHISAPGQSVVDYYS